MGGGAGFGSETNLLGEKKGDRERGGDVGFVKIIKKENHRQRTTRVEDVFGVAIKDTRRLQQSIGKTSLGGRDEREVGARSGRKYRTGLDMRKLGKEGGGGHGGVHSIEGAISYTGEKGCEKFQSQN